LTVDELSEKKFTEISLIFYFANFQIKYMKLLFPHAYYFKPIGIFLFLPLRDILMLHLT